MMKVVWITGASSGLGYSTAKALVRAGYTVVCGARSFEGQEGESETGYRLPLDVRDEKSCDAFCCRAREKFGAPWALVNAAGVLTLGACEQYAARELKDVLDTNFLGGVRMTQRVLADMRAQGAGRIVNFSSINGLLGIPFQGAYVASKHAIEGFSECLAAEVAPFGVQVMLVEPGESPGREPALPPPCRRAGGRRFPLRRHIRQHHCRHRPRRGERAESGQAGRKGGPRAWDASICRCACAWQA